MIYMYTLYKVTPPPQKKPHKQTKKKQTKKNPVNLHWIKKLAFAIRIFFFLFDFYEMLTNKSPTGLKGHLIICIDT